MANTAFHFSIVGYDIRSPSAVDDIRTDARFRSDMLAQHIDAVEGQHRSIEGISPIPRFAGSVGRLAVKGNAIVIKS